MPPTIVQSNPGMEAFLFRNNPAPPQPLPVPPPPSFSSLIAHDKGLSKFYELRKDRLLQQPPGYGGNFWLKFE